MFSNLISLINKSVSSAFFTPSVSQTQITNNPFASSDGNNPFVNVNFAGSTYAKNQPVPGGYFAGYHNGVPNIVGRKLFIEA